ncbi:spinster family MFS transporter [Novosphingobium sp. BL-52-GroH]|uniref:spinster family MFS transporter n=1 Tax=Novosphingobium sp. BL-52-GroH TaxID=3349877 RepID=UPI00384CD8D4
MSNEAGPGATARHEAPYPPAWQAWSVVAILFVVTLLSQLDRQIPALLVAPIKAEFGISDTVFSLLQGYAFALIYTLMGLPFGRLVDSTNRRNLIVGGVIVWSAMTALTAFANSYTILFIARMGVGVGEAVLAPAAYSIIADYVAPARRGRAISVYYLSLAIGQGASLLIGGLILKMIPPTGAEVPLLGSFEPWRMAFLIAGAPGIFLAALLFLVREPVRRETVIGSDGGTQTPTYKELFAFMRSNMGALWPIFLCPTALAIVGYAAVNWAVAYYGRTFGIPPQQIGVTLGIIVASGGMLGTLTSGFFGDWLVARGIPAARLRVMQVSMLITVLTAGIWSLMPTAELSLAVLGVMLFASVLGHSSAPVMVQEVVPNRMRGQIVAIYLLIAGLGGIALAPTAVALITDYVFQDESAVGLSLAIVGFPIALLGLIVAVASQRPYAEVGRRKEAMAG